MSLALDVERIEQRTQRPMSDHQKVLVALQKAGSTGLTGIQLGQVVPRYSTRISDLRRDGHVIVHVQEGRTHRFVLGDEQ